MYNEAYQVTIEASGYNRSVSSYNRSVSSYDRLSTSMVRIKLRCVSSYYETDLLQCVIRMHRIRSCNQNCHIEYTLNTLPSLLDQLQYIFNGIVFSARIVLVGQGGNTITLNIIQY